MINQKINKMKKRKVKKGRLIHRVLIDIRPLLERLPKKRIKKGQKPDALQILLFDNSQCNCTGYVSK